MVPRLRVLEQQSCHMEESRLLCERCAPWTVKNDGRSHLGPWGCVRLSRLTQASISAQVELLVMKALSVGLVKGSIDEVDRRVHMTWVQPRVLDLQQVLCLKTIIHLCGFWGVVSILS